LTLGVLVRRPDGPLPPCDVKDWRFSQAETAHAVARSSGFQEPDDNLSAGF